MSASPAPSNAPSDVHGMNPDKKKVKSTWIHVIGYIVTALLGSSGGLILGMWDRIFPPNSPPTVALVIKPSEGTVPLTVVADAGDSSDADGDEMSFRWSVNDEDMESESEVYHHTFEQVAVHSIRVTVKDEHGLQDQVAQTITVREKFDTRATRGELDTIKRWLNQGDISTAMESIRKLKHKCTFGSVSEGQCAVLYGYSANARLALGHVEDGIHDIAEATRLDPDSVFHRNTQAVLHLLDNNPNSVIAEFNELAKKKSIGAENNLYLAIAYALTEQYDKVRNSLGSILRGKNRFGPAASFTQHVTDVLENPTKDVFTTPEFQVIVCSDSTMLTIFDDTDRVVEKYVHSLRVLVKALETSAHRRLQEMLGDMKCN